MRMPLEPDGLVGRCLIRTVTRVQRGDCRTGAYILSILLFMELFIYLVSSILLSKISLIYFFTKFLTNKINT